MFGSPALRLCGRRAVFLSAVLGVFLLCSDQTTAQEQQQSSIALDLPIRCQPNVDCWIANYVDLDPGPGAKDYTCGPRSYQAHKGTDFAIRDLAVMNAGVEVLAAASGTVTGTRDGIKDIGLAGLDSPALKDKLCGNGVGIKHADGWFTQYCHLRRGSLSVKGGERVAAGQVLGLVGLSGNTTFPHLHLSVSRNGATVDPFRGEAAEVKCGIGNRALWQPAVLDKIRYKSAVIFNLGFATTAPKPEVIRDGSLRETDLSRYSPALVLWTEIFGVRSGDQLQLKVELPDGRRLFARGFKLNRTQAHIYRFSGQKRPDPTFQPGRYRGEAIIQRATPEGRKTIRAEAHVNIR